MAQTLDFVDKPTRISLADPGLRSVRATKRSEVLRGDQNWPLERGWHFQVRGHLAVGMPAAKLPPGSDAGAILAASVSHLAMFMHVTWDCDEHCVSQMFGDILATTQPGNRILAINQPKTTMVETGWGVANSKVEWVTVNEGGAHHLFESLEVLGRAPGNANALEHGTAVRYRLKAMEIVYGP